MCGINGITWKDEELVSRMNEATAHRGPDGTAFFTDGRVTLGHNLLAITDTPANCAQPVKSPDSRYALVYNGEIYNYRSLRDEMVAAGERFTSDADTEVLFTGLIRYGPEFLEQLDGMYAVAFYDSHKGSLMVARDPAGIKPLYWTVRPQGFIFSSELRGVLAADVPRALDPVSADLYLSLGYVPGPATMIRGIRKLCPGQCLTYRVPSGAIEMNWIGKWRNERLPDTGGDISEALRRSVGSSSRAQTMGLRPFGLYLSGGLDSGAVLHELVQGSAPFGAYTTRFDVPDHLQKDFNEDADIAARLCADYDVRHHELLVRGSEYAGAYESAVSAIEEPRWNAGIGAYWLLAREASKNIVVVLNGSGGDELFFGYPRYAESRRISERYSRYPDALVDAWYALAEYAKGRASWGPLPRLSRPLDRWAHLNRIGSHGTRDIVAELRDAGYPAVEQPLSDTENVVAELDRAFWLADEEYIRTDKISMHFGMEGRFPLMGREVIRLANAIPSARKLSDGTTKKLLRDAYRGRLPDYVIDKPKTGWKAPVTAWMNGEFGGLVKDTLSDGYYSGLKGAVDLVGPRGRVMGATSYSTRSMKAFLPMASLQIWARHFKITT